MVAVLVARGRLQSKGYSNTRGARVVHYTLTSRILGRKLAEVGVIPAGASTKKRPLLVFLHGRHDPGPLHFLGGDSAALWTSGGASAPGAFDDAEDYARNDVFAAARRGAYRSLPVWIDGGDRDPFRDADATFARLVHVPDHVSPGGHASSYWHAHMAEYLSFYASACR